MASSYRRDADVGKLNRPATERWNGDVQWLRGALVEFSAPDQVKLWILVMFTRETDDFVSE